MTKGPNVIVGSYMAPCFLLINTKLSFDSPFFDMVHLVESSARNMINPKWHWHQTDTKQTSTRLSVIRVGDIVGYRFRLNSSGQTFKQSSSRTRTYAEICFPSNFFFVGSSNIGGNQISVSQPVHNGTFKRWPSKVTMSGIDRYH